MRLVSAWVAVVAALPSIAQCSRLTPPVLPLIVRNPYLSTWLGNARDRPWEKWPMFWTGQEIGFSVLASLPEDRTAYPLLGRPHDSLRYDDERYDGFAAHLTVPWCRTGPDWRSVIISPIRSTKAPVMTPRRRT